MKRPRFLRRRSKSLVLSTSLLLAAAAMQVNAVTYDVPEGDTQTVNLPISGDEYLVKQGEGSLVLTASNSYTLGTHIMNGSVYLFEGGAINHPSGNLWVRDASFEALNGVSVHAENLWIDSSDPQKIGEVMLNGNTSVTLEDTLSVGGSGTGSMSIINSTVTAARLELGVAPDSHGSMSLSGSDTSLTISESADVGVMGYGSISINTGAKLEITLTGTHMSIGAFGEGSVEVSTEGLLSVSGTVMIGAYGAGYLSVYEEGVVNLLDGEVYIGYNFGSQGELSMYGGTLTVAEGLNVGHDGTGAIYLATGATLNVGDLRFGSGLYGSGSGSIFGEGTEVNATNISIGTSDGAYGTLWVAYGAKVSATDLTLALGEIQLTDGGQLVTSGTVYAEEGTSHDIFVSGSDTLWQHTSDLVVKGDGETYIYLSNGGRLQIDNSELPGEGELISEGNLYLYFGGLFDPEAPGYLDASYISTGANGSVVIEFTHTAEDYLFNVDLSGNISVYHYAGVTTFDNEMILGNGVFGVVGGTAKLTETLLQSGTVGAIYGTIIANDSTQINAENLLIGSYGNVTLSGSGTTLDASKASLVGVLAPYEEYNSDALGYLSIRNGAVARFDDDLIIGGGIGGLVTVSGEGSKLISGSTGVIKLGVYDDSVYGLIGTGSTYLGIGALYIANGAVVDLNDYEQGVVYLSGNGSGIVIGAAPEYGSEFSEAQAPGYLEAGLVTSDTNGGGSIYFIHTAHQEDEYVFSPNISGSVQILHISGYTILDGELTHMGTYMEGGTIQLGTNASYASQGDLLLAGATAKFDLNGHLAQTGNLYMVEGAVLTGGTLEVSGTIGLMGGTIDASLTGSASLVKYGTGTARLEGQHSYTGDTIIEGGVLDLVGSIESNSYVFGGTYNVSGLANGNVEVDGGILVVNGTVGGNVQVTSGVLNGNGNIMGNLVNGGWVAMGETPGTLTVHGNYTQKANGTLALQLASPASYDRLVVGGVASLNGNLYLVLGGVPGSETYQIITADGGVKGEFAEVSTNTLTTAHLSYLGNAVEVSFVQEASILEFARVQGLSSNVRSLARALDRANRRGQLGNLLDELYSTDLSELPKVLASLSPESLTQIYQLGFNAAQVQYNNIERRLDDVRNGAVGFSANGLALTNSRGSLNYDGTPIVNTRDGLQLAGFDGKSLVGKQHVAPVVTESRWGFFATGSGEWADVETTAKARGSSFSTGGFTVGADYRVSNNLVIGIAGGYTNISSDLFNGGKVDVNSGRGSVYATAFGNGFYGNALVGGAYNSYKTKRNTLGGTAFGNPDGGEFNALLGGGYDFTAGGWTIGPVASLQYTYLGLGSYTEHGSLAPMHFPSQSQSSLRSQLGGRVAYAWNVNDSVVIRPEVRLQWQHEYLDSTASVESSFAGGGGVFTVNGPELGRDSLILDAGVTVQFSNRASVYAAYTAELFRNNYSSNAVSGGFRINF